MVVVIGTPVDEHLNPTFHSMRKFFAATLPRMVDGQCLILRSTVFPGTTEKVRDMVAATGKRLHVAFCPERVAQGKAIEELTALPQIVSGCDETAVEMAAALFGRIALSIIRMTPREAELTKIFANVWRYIQFATANQFFMIANDFDADFYRIHDALTRDYPRMAGLPKVGFAAGPCLFKDTMQLAAANHNNFSLGHSAMLINEGLPNYVVRQMKRKYHLARLKVGLLGMAFKADCDDPRKACRTSCATSWNMRPKRSYVLTFTLKIPRFGRWMKSWPCLTCWSSARRIRNIGRWSLRRASRSWTFGTCTGKGRSPREDPGHRFRWIHRRLLD